MAIRKILLAVFSFFFLVLLFCYVFWFHLVDSSFVSGIESFSKLGDSIYFEEEGKVPGLYIIQYISSSLEWTSAQIALTQKVDPVVSWDPYLRLTLMVSSNEV